MLPACELSLCRDIITHEVENHVHDFELEGFSPVQTVYKKCKLPKEKRSRSRSKEKYDETLSTKSDSAERDPNAYEKASTSENKSTNKDRKNELVTQPTLYPEQIKRKEDLVDYQSIFQGKNIRKNSDFDLEEETPRIPTNINLALEDPRKLAFFAEVPSSFIKPNLVLDLDETLVNAALKNSDFGDFSTKSEFLREIQIKSATIILALRPFLTTFLQEASKYYNLFLYTHGHQIYAEKVLELIDAEKKYFDREKIFFNRESHPGIRTQKKTLKNLGFPPEEINRSVIIDDLKQVWVEHERVIPSKKFMPFMKAMEEEKYKTYTLDIIQEEGRIAELILDKEDIESYCETRFEIPDQLCCLLPFLKDLAFKFYDKQRYGANTVPQTMEDLFGYQMKRVLNRCCVKIITTDPSREEMFKRIALKLGAKVADNLDFGNVSHVIIDRPRYINSDTIDFVELMKNLTAAVEKDNPNVRIVGVNWLLQCYFVLEQLPASRFLMKWGHLMEPF